MACVILRFYPGFMLAAFEIVEYTFYTALSVVWIDQFFCDQLNWDSKYQPLIWLSFYASAVFIIFMGDAFY